MAALAVADLLLRVGPLDRALRDAVAERAQRTGRVPARAGQLYVSEEQALARLDELHAGERARASWALTPEESASLLLLREEAEALGSELPLDELSRELELDEFELGCVLACAAPELDAEYGRLYGYVVDDLGRAYPSVELLLALAGGTEAERIELSGLVGPLGQLRRQRVLVATRESQTELRRELRLAPGLIEFLRGEDVEFGAIVGDVAAVGVPVRVEVPAGADGRKVRRLGVALRQGTVSVVGVYGPDPGARERVVLAAARAAGLPLRRLDGRRLLSAGLERERVLTESLLAASALGALLWIEIDALAEDEAAPAGDDLTLVLRASRVPVLLSGETPWRPSGLLAARAYAEVEMQTPTFAERRVLWGSALPELDLATAGDLAARYPVGTTEVRAAAAMARVTAAVSANGHALGELVEEACSTVARRRTYRFATLIRPRRRPEDLVLPETLHTQVLEIASSYRNWPRVSEAWDLGRLASRPGQRVLMSGESGTGKSLAAEVIAGLLSLDLLKVRVGEIASKWVGETEKNLEAAFAEAEESAAVLFFDEADSLFAKRGEVRHGTDRYANLEVGYLLQRLEAFSGLVVLATNLRENIDDAFSRRFDTILHFPRPAEPERRRIWVLSLPAAARAEDVDLDALAKLDITGAGIVATARTAALLAATEDADEIEMRHLVQATARQFRSEGRVLSPAQLGHHAALL